MRGARAAAGLVLLGALLAGCGSPRFSAGSDAGPCYRDLALAREAGHGSSLLGVHRSRRTSSCLFSFRTPKAPQPYVLVVVRKHVVERVEPRDHVPAIRR